MFDGVEFETIRRIVQDENPHADPVGMTHEVLFDNMVPTGIRPTTITENYERTCIGIKFLQMIVPNMLDIVAHEL